jgi:hypothetical protein
VRRLDAALDFKRFRGLAGSRMSASAENESGVKPPHSKSILVDPFSFAR